MFIRDILNFEQGTVIDVRSEEEFALMRAANTVNIPLGLLLYSLDVLKNLPKPWMFCCEEGARSGLAVHLLKNIGFKEIYNAGAWNDVEREQEEVVRELAA